MAVSSRPALDRDLLRLLGDLLRLGSQVDQQLERAMKALRTRDLQLARQVAEVDERLDQLRYQLEQECVSTIAMQQPAATDLRRIIAIAHMTVELERMADHARGIATIALRLADEPLPLPLTDAERMAEVARDMTRQALDAFVRMDAGQARRVAALDDEIDALYRKALGAITERMRQDASCVTAATYLLWVVHNLERVGDRATNLCERVIFAATGALGDYKPEKIDPAA
jgi:phosphate transport system protein